MRINLNVDEMLFDLIKADADKKNVSINMYVIGLLEKLYRQQPFNYEDALNKLIEDALSVPSGKPFLLSELESFSEVCVAKAEKSNIQPSIVRARLGKNFNKMVQEEKIYKVNADGKKEIIVRHLNQKGELAFRHKAALFIKKEKEN